MDSLLLWNLHTAAASSMWMLLLLFSWKTKFTHAVSHGFDVGELFPPLSAARSSKQKHSPLCSRVRNNVCDEAAHNVPPLRSECDPFLSIHNAGASLRRPPRLRGPAPPPSVRYECTAERSENKRLWPSTETSGRGPGTDSCCVRRLTKAPRWKRTMCFPGVLMREGK